ncbi:MAG: polyphosphate:AMP phosphotransferase, partial [Pseudomonadota bacterium]
MFESAELGHSVPDREYDRAEPKLREALLKAQYDLLANKSFPVIILIGGVDGAGKGETVNILNEWMDPRFIHTHAFGEMSDEERERPRMWRYWRALPPKGRIGVLFGAWHTDPIVNRVAGRSDDAQLELAMEEIVRFERMLVDEGALLLKFWFHLSRKAQKKRLKALESDPKTRWRVTDTDWERFRLYDRFRKVSESALRETSTGYAPWIVVEGTDPNYRYLTVGRTILAALRKRLAGDKPVVTRPAALPEPALDGRTVLSSLDYETRLTRKAYLRKLEKYQGELNLLSRHK